MDEFQPRHGTTDAADAACTLVVLDGPQSGARAPLPAGRHVVGGGLDGDVVVGGLADAYFLIEAGPRPVLRAGTASLRLACGAVLEGEAARTLGARDARDGLRFRTGGVSFRLDTHATPPRPALRRMATPAAAICACAGVALVLLSVPGFGSSASPSLLTDATLPAPIAPMLAPVLARPAPDAAAASAALDVRLGEAGVAGLRVQPVADGSVVVSGSVPPGQATAWADTMRWFDASYGDRVVLVDRVGRSVRTSPLAIAGVRLGGEAPCVIDASGRHLFVGSEAGDGWAVAAIEASRVTLRRGTETLSVRF